MSHDDRHQAGASACSVLVFLFGAKEAGAGAEPRRQAKVSILVQRDQDHEASKTEVIVEPKMASPAPLIGEDHL